MREKLNNLSIRQLRAMEEIARHRSFVEAAAQLHITPSALSESIKALEGILGLRLFDRTTRSVRPTAAGKEFLDHVHAALGQLERAVEVVAELQNLERGLVRCIGATSALACLVSPCLSQLWRRAPQVRVEMRTNVANEVVNALKSGSADFYVGSCPTESTDEIEFRPLIHDRLGLVAHRDHPLVQSETADLRQVRNVPYVALTTLTTIDKVLGRQRGIAPDFLEPVVRVDGTGTMAAVLQQGVAVGILPALAMHHMGLADLSFCPLGQPFHERTIGMCRLHDRSLAPAAQALWDMVTVEARNLVGVQGIRLCSDSPSAAHENIMGD